MTSFDRAIAFVLDHEGGYSNDPDDPGGETNFGISKRAFPDVDIAGLTISTAADIYRKKYWDQLRCDHLPWPIAMVVFDTAVNCGAVTAAKWLQSELGVHADGVIGPQTIAAIENHGKSHMLLRALLVRRAMHYCINPKVAKFGNGWFGRLFDLRLEAME